MKVKRLISLIMVAVITTMFAVPVLGVEDRASAQIAAYDMEVLPVSGSLAVYFNITGNGSMKKIGCESIYVYKMVGSKWELVDDQTKLEDDDGMSNTSIHAHVNTIHCDSTKGTHYKVVVTVFAENAKGRDSRSETFYTTGK